jgi:hypothetical protein
MYVTIQCLLIRLDDGCTNLLGVFFNRRKQPLFFEAAVEFRLGSRVVLPSHDIQLDPGRHTTLGPLGDLVDDHDVVHLVQVVVLHCRCDGVFVKILNLW